MTADLSELREQLATRVAGASPEIATALRTVPRHLFLPGVPPAEAYLDEAIVTKRDATGVPVSSSSQPAIMAIMLRQLNLAPGHRVLEIGAGTGYNAALLSELTGPAGRVVSIDIDPEVAAEARDHLAAAGYPDVTVLAADGAEGSAADAPFDRLIATVGVSDLAPAWLDQVTDQALIVVPLDVRGAQLSVAFQRAGDGHWTSRSISPCGFMRMRGSLAGSTMAIELATGLRLRLPERRELALVSLDGGPVASEPTGVTSGTPDVTWGLLLWLAVHEPRACELTEEPRPGQEPRLTQPLFQHRAVLISYGIVADEGGIAVLARDEDRELIAEGYGPGGADLAAELTAQVRAWYESGSESMKSLRIDAYPRSASAQPPAAGLIVERPRTRFAVGHA